MLLKIWKIIEHRSNATAKAPLSLSLSLLSPIQSSSILAKFLAQRNQFPFSLIGLLGQFSTQFGSRVD